MHLCIWACELCVRRVFHASMLVSALAAWPSSSPNATCGAVVDRHIPKTAGTTFRSVLRQNDKLGNCYYAGYDVSSTWKSRAGFNHVSFREIVRAVPQGGRFWCVEAHVVTETFWADVAALRLSAAAARCTVVTMVRVREPYSWYGSYYRWAVLERQRGAEPKFGDNFTDWLPYNLQSTHLLFGDEVSRGLKRGVALSRRPRRSGPRAAPRRLSTEQWAGLRRIMAATDVMTPLDRLDEAMVLLTRRVGFLSWSVYRRHRPGPMRGPWDKVQPKLPVADLPTFCAEGERRRACQAAVEEAAPDDRMLYQMVVDAFERQIAPLRADPTFQQQLLLHRAGVRALNHWALDDGR